MGKTSKYFFHFIVGEFTLEEDRRLLSPDYGSLLSFFSQL